MSTRRCLDCDRPILLSVKATKCLHCREAIKRTRAAAKRGSEAHMAPAWNGRKAALTAYDQTQERKVEAILAWRKAVRKYERAMGQERSA